MKRFSKYISGITSLPTVNCLLLLFIFLICVFFFSCKKVDNIDSKGGASLENRNKLQRTNITGRESTVINDDIFDWLDKEMDSA